MTTAATITCYIQPTTAHCAYMAWVDTDCTTVLRREVSSATEAANVIAEARRIAAAMGYPAIIKKLVTTNFGDKAPRGVRKMQGNEVAA